VDTIVSYIKSLHNILRLWRVHLVICSILQLLTSQGTFTHFPYTNGLSFTIFVARSSFVSSTTRGTSVDLSILSPVNVPSWTNYHTLLVKPGTGKSLVSIRVRHHLLNNNAHTMIATHITVLANRYEPIFAHDVTCKAMHAVFRVPINSSQPTHCELLAE